MTAGRPTDYTPELIDEFCSRLATGASMRTVCEDIDMPARTTIFRWLREKPEFKHQYEKAKEEACDALAEEILDIADDGSNDWMERTNKDGDCIGWQVNGEHVQRSRLRVDARKWILSKVKPKVYGDSTTLRGDPENPIVTRQDLSHLSPAELEQLSQILERANGSQHTDTDAG